MSHTNLSCTSNAMRPRAPLPSQAMSNLTKATTCNWSKAHGHQTDPATMLHSNPGINLSWQHHIILTVVKANMVHQFKATQFNEHHLKQQCIPFIKVCGSPYLNITQASLQHELNHQPTIKQQSTYRQTIVMTCLYHGCIMVRS